MSNALSSSTIVGNLQSHRDSATFNTTILSGLNGPTSPWYFDANRLLDTHTCYEPTDFFSISQDLGVRKAVSEMLQQLTSAHDSRTYPNG